MINPRIQNDDVKTSALIFIKMDAFCLEAIDPLINIPHHDADVFNLCHMIIWIMLDVTKRRKFVQYVDAKLIR